MIRASNIDSTDLSLVIIEDSATTNADEFFLALILNDVKVGEANIQIICTEKSSDYYKLKAKDVSLEITDLVTDPLQWSTQTGSVFKIPPLSSLFPQQDKSLRKYVFIDSVSPFIRNYGLRNFVIDLRKLALITNKVVIRVHSDTLLHANDSNLLQHLCSTHIVVLERFGPKKFLIQGTHKKRGGKMLLERQNEMVEIDQDWGVSSSIYTTNVKKSFQRVTPMDSLTTFNLGVAMSDAEKQARDQLVLPYLRTSEDSGSKILYEADDADLEEDPDEDLEL